MKAEDILPDNQDFVKIQGHEIRKGSIGAFMLTCKTLLEHNEDSKEYKMALEDIESQVPLLNKIGLFDFFELKSPRLKEIVTKFK